MEFKELYQGQHSQLIANHSLRELHPARGLDFCSNDYLSLSQDGDLRGKVLESMARFPLGSTGSRLLRGNSSFTEDLEEALSRFSLTESALYFPTGYQANLGLFSALLKHNAVVFSDELVHASIIDGIRLAGCAKYIWSHNNLKELEMFLQQKVDPSKVNYVVVESVYSMGGEFAPLAEIADLCEKYKCHLIVDEAHATGLYGENGSGRVEELRLKHKVFATIHTGGKALGVSGAWVAGSKNLRNLLINFSRPFIYSTAPAFYQQIALKESLQFFAENREKFIHDFFKNVVYLQSLLASQSTKLGYSFTPMVSPVTAVVIGDNQKAMQMMASLAQDGFDVRAIRPPSVPQGKALLRITVSRLRTSQEIDSFFASFVAHYRNLQ